MRLLQKEEKHYVNGGVDHHQHNHNHVECQPSIFVPTMGAFIGGVVGLGIGLVSIQTPKPLLNFALRGGAVGFILGYFIDMPVQLMLRSVWDR